jgi:hypothetical protein
VNLLVVAGGKKRDPEEDSFKKGSPIFAANYNSGSSSSSSVMDFLSLGNSLGHTSDNNISPVSLPSTTGEEHRLERVTVIPSIGPRPPQILDLSLWGLFHLEAAFRMGAWHKSELTSSIRVASNRL